MIKKLIKFLNKKILRTPGVEFLKKNYLNESKKLAHINFWINMSKRKKGFQNFFFDNSADGDIAYRFPSNEECVFTGEMLKSLSHNGVLVICNALPEDERKKIINCFEELKKKSYTNCWTEVPTSVSRSNDYDLERGYVGLNLFPILKKYSEQASLAIYDKIVNPTIELHYLKLKSAKEEPIRGETFLHSDRFVPHFKMFYTPFAIERDDAPLEFSLGSHKINEDYINFFLKSKYFDETDIESKKIKKRIEKIIVPKNSLYIAFTNGLHRRTPLLKENSERCMIFMQYVERYNKLNYLLP